MIGDLKEIPRRYPDIDLALLHLGGTWVLGVMVTMDGKQGVEMVRLVNPKRAIPIHRIAGAGPLPEPRRDLHVQRDAEP